MTAREDQLASGHAGVLYLLEMQFASGTLRYTNWSHSLLWMGHTWVGLGTILSVSKIEESERLQYPAVELGLSIANQSQLALALGGAQEYRNRPVTVYMGVLDDELRVVGDPEVVWAGLMDQVRIKTGNGEDEEGAVAMRCEMPGRDTRGPASLRLNNAQQQARYPGDTGLSRIEQLSGQPVTWLSKRFQRQD